MLDDIMRDSSRKYHEFWIHSFVVVIEIYPAPNPSNSFPPFSRVAEHDASTFLVIIPDSELQYIFFSAYL